MAIFLLFISSCSTTDYIGSLQWHEQRLKEIEDAFANGEITKAEYLSLKNETDNVRAVYNAGMMGGVIHTPD